MNSLLERKRKVCIPKHYLFAVWRSERKKNKKRSDIWSSIGNTYTNTISMSAFDNKLAIDYKAQTIVELSKCFDV